MLVESFKSYGDTFPRQVLETCSLDLDLVYLDTVLQSMISIRYGVSYQLSLGVSFSYWAISLKIISICIHSCYVA